MRTSPPPPKPDPPSIRLLRAIGDLQDARDDERITADELDAIAAASGVHVLELSPLIQAGISAGYPVQDHDGDGPGLTGNDRTCDEGDDGRRRH
jgi:hypothetical protein